MPRKNRPKKDKDALRATLGLSLKKKGPGQGVGGGAPVGNTNYTRGRIFRQALLRVIRSKSRSDRLEELERIAAKLADLAKRGNIPAIRELVDRVDGKAIQAIVGDGENPLLFKDVSKLSDEELKKLAQAL